MDKQITALLLSWKRQKNLEKIIHILKNQTVPINIFLWNNNKLDTKNYDVDLQINSSINLMCSARWLMANYSKSDFYFSLDDDIVFKDNDVIKDCYNFSTENNNCAIGYSGVILNSTKNYVESQHITANKLYNYNVDIIKGRFLFLSKDDLKKTNFFKYEKLDNFRIEDDIIISSNIKNKIIPSFLNNRFIELFSNDSLYKQKDHWFSRIKTTQEYF
jgi:hypothetical protein